MARIDNLKKNELATVVSRVRRTETTAPLGSTSVHNGRTRFVGDGSLLVEGLNALRVTGSAIVSGLLSVTGTLRVIGAFFIDGITTVTGVWNQNGPWNLAGAGGITGDVVQTGTTRVRGGGKVIVEGTDPVTLGLTSAGRPGLQFGTGSQVVGTSDGAQLNNAAGNGFVFAGDTVGMQRGSKHMNVTAAGVEVSLAVAPAGTTVYMVVADASGNLFRKSTAA